mmetsp:Transcript_128395/g.410605  ORF Transcript_128395/g.410605 Transcript_128395/m.410605 type:complete len:232 (+) Transcript_128395:233-928(+)
MSRTSARHCTATTTTSVLQCRWSTLARIRASSIGICGRTRTTKAPLLSSKSSRRSPRANCPVLPMLRRSSPEPLPIAIAESGSQPMPQAKKRPTSATRLAKATASANLSQSGPLKGARRGIADSSTSRAPSVQMGTPPRMLAQGPQIRIISTSATTWVHQLLWSMVRLSGSTCAGDSQPSPLLVVMAVRNVLSMATTPPVGGPTVARIRKMTTRLIGVWTWERCTTLNPLR